MTTQEIRKLKEAIYLITCDAQRSEFEDGMLILYKLAGMTKAVQQIENLRKATGIKITDIK